MVIQKNNLGKVAVTVEKDYWSINKDYDKLTIVEKEGNFGTYISRKPVPAGKELTDRDYWIPFSSLKEEIALQFGEVVNSVTEISKYIEQYKPIVIEGDVVNAPDEEDLTTTILEGTETIKFKDKLNSPAHFSGYGRKYLRKNIISEAAVEKLDPTILSVADPEVAPGEKVPATINDAIEAIQTSEERVAARITHAYWDLRAGEGGVAVLYDRDTTNESTVAGHWSIGYIVLPVNAGETVALTANFVSSTANANPGYFWAVIDNISEKHIIQCDETVSYENIAIHSQISIAESGLLVINHITYQTPPYSIRVLSKSGEVRNFNILPTMEEENTIYKIQYDYDLNGRSISFPKNSILQFEGGSIRNAYIEGNNALIVAAETDDIFGRNTELTGTWKNIDWYPEWFGAVGDGIVDDTIPLQKVLYLYDDIHSLVNCIMYGHTYKVTTGLYFINNTSIKGGTLVAEFENPLDWVLQTRTLYNGVQMRYMNYCDWGAHDSGYVNQTNGGTIEDLTIQGVLNKHMVIPEGGDETSEKVWDGTYCPIYGGLKIQASRTINTKNVVISNVGTAVGRAACLKTKDESGEFSGCFTGFNGYAINGHVITTSYVNANCHYKSSGESDTKPVVPYYPEYAVSSADTGFRYAFKGEYIVGTGGIDDTDDSKRMPALCCIKIGYAYSMIIDNVLIDRTCDVAIAGYYASITVRNAWFEGVRKCIAYGISSRMSFSVPFVLDAAVFDFIGSTMNLTLDNCEGRISGIGGEDDPLNETMPAIGHKYCLDNSSQINILNRRPTNFPDDDRFTFTRIGKDMQVVAMTRAQFDAITERDKWTLYLIMSDGANPTITNVYSKGERIMPSKPSTITFEDANVLDVLSTAGYVTPDESDNVSLNTVESITNIGTIFRFNTVIESFYEFGYFSGIKSMNSFTFGGCTSLKIVALPRKLESISATILENGGTKTVVFIPKTLKSTVNFMGGQTCTNLVLLAIVPPTLSANVARITNLYVPDESVSAYQNNENWVAWCTNIKSLSEFDVDNPSLVDVKNNVLDIYDL